MIAKEFDEVNVRIAENQDEYETLPAFCNTQEGTAMVCFELDEDEKKQVTETGLIYMKVLTGNGKLQPIAMSVIKDDLFVPMIENETKTGE